ncbi:hypothetical protein V5N11_031360 [Cardamine amara subsp. amara]|uniref:Uncharacterized protein n=1 Tax=Cardamine amara subsp. amara TaxID=228776 RepID=A0ABD1A9G2_CARAN
MVAGHSMARSLVDTGSSVDVLFEEALRKMDLASTNYLVKPNYRPLASFDGDTTMSRGTIKLPLMVGGECRTIKFKIVDKPAIYNIILGTPWLYLMKAVATTYHQCLKLPTPTGPFTLYGDQLTARSCFVIEHQLLKKSETPQT